MTDSNGNKIPRWDSECSPGEVLQNQLKAAPLCNCWDTRGSEWYVQNFELAKTYQAFSVLPYRPECIYPACLTGTYDSVQNSLGNSPTAAPSVVSLLTGSNKQLADAMRNDTVQSDLYEEASSFNIKTKFQASIDTGITRCPVNCVTNNVYDFENSTVRGVIDITNACCNRGRLGIVKNEFTDDKTAMYTAPRACRNVKIENIAQNDAFLEEAIETVESNNERQEILVYVPIALMIACMCVVIVLVSIYAVKRMKLKKQL